MSSTFEMWFSICHHSIGNISITKNCSAIMQMKKKPSLSNTTVIHKLLSIVCFFSWWTIFKFSLALKKLWAFLFKQNQKVLLIFQTTKNNIEPSFIFARPVSLLAIWNRLAGLWTNHDSFALIEFKLVSNAFNRISFAERKKTDLLNNEIL